MESHYVKLLSPYCSNMEFLSILGINEAQSIIDDTNSFITDNCPVVRYANTGNIYGRLFHTYNVLKNTRESETVEDEMFLLANPFSGRNIGHDLSIIFHRIHIYIKNKLTCPLVISDQYGGITHVVEICKILLPSAVFYVLKSDKIVLFKKLYVVWHAINPATSLFFVTFLVFFLPSLLNILISKKTSNIIICIFFFIAFSY